MSRITRKRGRERNLKGTTRFLFLAPRKEKILPRRSTGVGDRALFKLICLIKFVSIPFLLPREDEIIPKSHRSPAKAHQSSLPRPLEEGREKVENGESAQLEPPFFHLPFFCSVPGEPYENDILIISSTRVFPFGSNRCEASQRARRIHVLPSKFILKESKIGKIRMGRSKIPEGRKILPDARERERERKRASRKDWKRWLFENYSRRRN